MLRSLACDASGLNLCSTHHVLLLRGNKVLKIFTSVLLIAVAGGAAVFLKQEMDKTKTTNSEILVVDDKIDQEVLESQ